MKLFNFVIKVSSSLKFAVVLIIYLGIVSAVGTVMESKYDATVAQKLVYYSWYNIGGLLVLALVLIAVMVDRWPWKRHHAGFIFAHNGIIILLIGAWVTQKYGIDGSMAFEIGKSQKNITVSETEFMVFTSLTHGNFTLMNDKTRRVDFLTHRPSPEDPHVVSLGAKKVEVLEYHHFTNRDAKIQPSENPKDGAALRIQLESSRMNMTQWIRRPGTREFEKIKLGPAELVLTKSEYTPKENTILFEEKENGISYKVYSKRLKKFVKSGMAKVGQVVPTGWMDIKIRFFQIYPHALEKITFKPQEGPGPMTNAAIKLRFDGKEHWMGLNSSLRLFDESKAYVVSYGNRRIPVDFDIKLTNFEVGRYQGSRQAMSYASDVMVKGKSHHISMNNPLKHHGYTFYQASFEEDETGQPTVSILSVNRDPGRFLKYLGSLLIVLGSIILFYFKKMMRKKKAAYRETKE